MIYAAYYGFVYAAFHCFVTTLHCHYIYHCYAYCMLPMPFSLFHYTIVA